MTRFSELLRRVRRGDRAAVTAILEIYRSRVERMARRGLGRRLAARYSTSDITQSVFTDMLEELSGLEDRGEAAFVAWLRTKVRHKLASKARRQVRPDGSPREVRLDQASEPETPAAAPDPADEASRREDLERVTALLGTLEHSQTAIIGLFLDEGLPWKEVARRLHLPSAAAARMRYVRAVATLRERWTRT